MRQDAAYELVERRSLLPILLPAPSWATSATAQAPAAPAESVVLARGQGMVGLLVRVMLSVLLLAGHWGQEVAAAAAAAIISSPGCKPGGTAKFDMFRANMTVTAANDWCQGNPKCAGFCSNSSVYSPAACASGNTTVMDMHFVDSWAFARLGSDPAWTSWLATWPVVPADVFVSGTEGYPWYRIPALVRLPNGNIAAFAEGRKTATDIGYNDIVYKVSPDEGATWSQLRVLWSESNATTHVAIHNPVPVVTGGKVLVVFNRNMRDCLTIRSLDGSGTVWEKEPVDITVQLTNFSGVLTTGPPQGLALPSGRILVAAGGSSIQGGRAIFSDDGGLHWAISSIANPKGGEAQIALAPNGSLLLNSRGPAQGVRWQSASHDNGSTWSAPRVLDFGFGSSCEGSIISMPRTGLLLFSHAGRIGSGRASINRWNLSVWCAPMSTIPPFVSTANTECFRRTHRMTTDRASRDGATWSAFHQAEHGLNETQLRGIHTAYSSLIALNDTHAAMVYERGPMGSRVGAGEYATIRWQVIQLPV